MGDTLFGFTPKEVYQASFDLGVAGAVTSGIGSYFSAAGNKAALSSSAQLDMINARSSAMAADTQADLSLVNTKSAFEAQTFNAAMGFQDTLSNTQASEFSAEFGLQKTTNDANLNIMHATNSGAFSELQADNSAKVGMIQAQSQAAALQAGAQMDELQAQLHELQAQSSLLHGQWKEQDMRMQYAQAKSQVTVRMGAGNIDMGQGVGLQARVGIDLMAERAATQIQQETLMQAFGSRLQEAQAQVSASSKMMQAGQVVSMAALSGELTKNMTHLQAVNSIGEAKLQGDYAISNANYNLAMTHANNTYTLSTAASKVQWTNSMASAGLINAEAALAHERVNSKISLENAQSMANIKQARADSISPGMSFLTSILGSATSLGGQWANMQRSINGV